MKGDNRRHNKTEFVLVRMTPELKAKLDKEARRRRETPSTLARILIAESLMLTEGINGIADRRKRRTHGRR